MTDLRPTIVPKSDQTNFDDFIAGAKTIKITSVKVSDGEQSVSIGYEGDNGKPWKPCKSMRRVLILAWGANGDDYIGRLVTLYGDTKVKWAGEEVGGIRISHLSHITDPIRMMLTVSKGKKVSVSILPIITAPVIALSEESFNEYETRINEAQSMPDLATIRADIKTRNYDKAGLERIAIVYTKASDRIRGIVTP